MRKMIRSNTRGVMTLNRNGTYSVFDNKTQSVTYSTKCSDAARSYWNRNYATSRQFSTPNGVNHCYL